LVDNTPEGVGRTANGAAGRDDVDGGAISAEGAVALVEALGNDLVDSAIDLVLQAVDAAGNLVALVAGVASEIGKFNVRQLDLPFELVTLICVAPGAGTKREELAALGDAVLAILHVHGIEEGGCEEESGNVEDDPGDHSRVNVQATGSVGRRDGDSTEECDGNDKEHTASDIQNAGAAEGFVDVTRVLDGLTADEALGANVTRRGSAVASSSSTTKVGLRRAEELIGSACKLNTRHSRNVGDIVRTM